MHRGQGYNIDHSNRNNNRCTLIPSKELNVSTTSKEAATVFVGTYTDHEGSQSKGIYVYRMDSSSGELTFEREVKGALNPSYLVLHPQRGYLYAVNEVQSFAGEETGGVSAFSIDSISREVNLLNARSSRGKDPCYISLDQTGRFVLVANYTGGNAAMLPIHADGRLGAATDVVQHSGSSVDPERQTAPYVHSILPDPTNRFAIVADLGADKLVVYAMDLEIGRLQKHTEVKTQPGAGPRHAVFHPNGQYAYVINELNSTLAVYRYRSDAGSLEDLQTISTLPEGYKDRNLCADLHICGKYLYASNRGHDSIACFFVDEHTGLLTYQNHTLTGGSEPRNFAIDPSGSFLLAANQKTHNIVTFRIDPTSGRLTNTGHEAKVSMPVCLKFA